MVLRCSQASTEPVLHVLPISWFLLAYVTLDECMTSDLKAPRKLLALAEIVLGKEPLCNVQYGDPGRKQI